MVSPNSSTCTSKTTSCAPSTPSGSSGCRSSSSTTASTPSPRTSTPMTPLASSAGLDQLTITIVVDNATDTLSSIAPGIAQLPEIAYLLGGVPPSGEHDGHSCVVVFDQLCVACHGFSALATARQGDRTATVLFDVGPYGDVWLANAG